MIPGSLFRVLRNAAPYKSASSIDTNDRIPFSDIWHGANKISSIQKCLIIRQKLLVARVTSTVKNVRFCCCWKYAFCRKLIPILARSGHGEDLKVASDTNWKVPGRKGIKLFRSSNRTSSELAFRLVFAKALQIINSSVL